MEVRALRTTGDEKKAGMVGCAKCVLSAVCLPIGPRKLAAITWRCCLCKRLFLEDHWTATESRDPLKVNENCEALMEQLKWSYEAGRCYECQMTQAAMAAHRVS